MLLYSLFLSISSITLYPIIKLTRFRLKSGLKKRSKKFMLQSCVHDAQTGKFVLQCVSPELLYAGGVYLASTQPRCSPLSTAVFMKWTPRAPSCTVGKSVSNSAGDSPAIFAAIVREAFT